MVSYRGRIIRLVFVVHRGQVWATLKLPFSILFVPLSVHFLPFHSGSWQRLYSVAQVYLWFKAHEYSCDVQHKYLFLSCVIFARPY